MTPSWPQSHAHLMDAYLRGLFALALDTDGGVRKEVCSGIVSLLYRAPEKLAPNMREVIAYMIERTSDGDEDVALESCEFWAAFCEADLERDTVEVLREFTPKLIPMLLTNMKYAEDDEEVIAAEEDEANAGREDRDQDVRPSFKGQRDRGDGASGGVSGSAADDGDETYYDAGEDDDDDAQWNLRKSSANGLDVMSNVFGDELLGMILPIVEQRFRESDWRLRESAILAVGAVSEGATPASRRSCRSSSSFSCLPWRTRGPCSAPPRAGPCRALRDTPRSSPSRRGPATPPRHRRAGPRVRGTYPGRLAETRR